MNSSGFRDGGHSRLPDDGADVTDACDFLAHFRIRAATGVEGLLVAMLEQAVHELAKFRGAERLASRRLYVEAAEWVLFGDESVLSFSWVCEHLGIEPSWLRSRLVRQGLLPHVTASGAQLSLKTTSPVESSLKSAVAS